MVSLDASRGNGDWGPQDELEALQLTAEIVVRHNITNDVAVRMVHSAVFDLLNARNQRQAVEMRLCGADEENAVAQVLELLGEVV